MMNTNLSKKDGWHLCNFISFPVMNTDSPSSDQCHFYTQAPKPAFIFFTVLPTIRMTETSLNFPLSREVNRRSNFDVVSLSAVNLTRQTVTDSPLLAVCLGTDVTKPNLSVQQHQVQLTGK